MENALSLTGKVKIALLFLRLRELNNISTIPTSPSALYCVKEKCFRPDKSKNPFPGITS